jgi:hypothetical protein
MNTSVIRSAIHLHMQIRLSGVSPDTGIPARLDLSRSAMVAEDDSPAQQRGTSVPKGARDG